MSNYSLILTVIISTLGDIIIDPTQPWQAFEKTLGRPSVAFSAPRRFSSFVASLLRIRTILNEVKDLAHPVRQT